MFAPPCRWVLYSLAACADSHTHHCAGVEPFQDCASPSQALHSHSLMSRAYMYHASHGSRAWMTSSEDPGPNTVTHLLSGACNRMWGYSLP